MKLQWLDVAEATHEKVCLFRSAGCEGYIAIHSTLMGNPMGATRYCRYPSASRALRDALALSETMTRKFTFAELPVGGAKAVIFSLHPDRDFAFREYGRVLRAVNHQLERDLGRVFITGKDLGVTLDDLERIVDEAGPDYVVGRRSSPIGDTATRTAHYVATAIETCACFLWSDGSLTGKVIAIQGLGAVGMALVEALVAQGAPTLIASERSHDAAACAKRRFPGLEVLGPHEADLLLRTPCDILAPCAGSREVTRRVIEKTNATVICGGANIPLAESGLEEEMFRNGVLYAPDFCVNSAGAVAVASEALCRESGQQTPNETADRLSLEIPKRLLKLLKQASAEGRSPAKTARQIVERILAEASH